MLESLEIPNKSTFKLNEVCGLTGVKPYVLRFWENEFDEIDPITSSSGQKLYEPQDIEAILTIKKILFTEKMKIEEAKGELARRLAQKDSSMGGEGSSDEIAVTSITRMGLSHSDIDKLMMAKNLLNEIVSRDSSLLE